MTELRLAEIKAHVRELTYRVPEFFELFDYIEKLEKENENLKDRLYELTEEWD